MLRLLCCHDPHTHRYGWEEAPDEETYDPNTDDESGAVE
jgi:hypothetical protein